MILDVDIVSTEKPVHGVSHDDDDLVDDDGDDDDEKKLNPALSRPR